MLPSISNVAINSGPQLADTSEGAPTLNSEDFTWFRVTDRSPLGSWRILHADPNIIPKAGKKA